MTLESVGRNDACPCGSGKKYKVCCLNRDKSNPRTNEMIAVGYYAGADTDKVDRLVTKHSSKLMAAVAENRSRVSSGWALLQIDGYFLAAYDRDSAASHGFSMEPGATLFVLGMPADCELADSIRTELASDKGLLEVDPETLEPKHDGEFVDFDGARGFFISDRVPFFRLRRRRFGPSDHENGPGWIQSAFFSGVGRTVHIWKMFLANGDEFPLCVDIYEEEIQNDFGLDNIETMVLRWDLEFKCAWPQAIALPKLGVTACTIDDPNELEVPMSPS